jgi:hypothetical protein
MKTKPHPCRRFRFPAEIIRPLLLAHERYLQNQAALTRRYQASASCHSNAGRLPDAVASARASEGKSRP